MPVLAPRPIDEGGAPAGVVEGLPKANPCCLVAAGVVEPNNGAEGALDLGVPNILEDEVCGLLVSGCLPRLSPPPELLPPPVVWPKGLLDD